MPSRPSGNVASNSVIRSVRLATLLVACLVVAGCASEARVLRLDSRPGDLVARAWPAPPAAPRLTYLGDLTGEANLATATSTPDPAAIRLLRWIAGIGQRETRPVRLLRPQSGTVDAARGRILVTDMAQKAVFVFDELAGTLDVWDRVADGRPFDSPVGIVVQHSGDVLVADAGLPGIVRLDGNGRPLGVFGASRLQRPAGMAQDSVSGELYVADSRAHRVVVFDAEGRWLRDFGEPGDAPGQLNAPVHVSFSRGYGSAGELYVSDMLNAQVLVFDTAGRLLRTIGQRGLYVGNLVRPKGVATDSDGNVYVLESNHDHLLVFDRDGRFLLPIGGTGDGIGEFYLPAGIWRDDADRLFVADMFNGRIVVMQYLGNG